MEISVIIPVYNVAAWLNQCMESVVRQTFTDFEAVLIDDGSTDGSGELCDEWAAKDGRIAVIHKENQGLSAARNDGIRRAAGKYLVFLDSDDWWELDFLEKLYDKAEAQKADMAECDIWRVNSLTGKKTVHKVAGIMGKEYSLEEQLIYGYTAIWKCMFKRELFVKNGLLFSDCFSPARPLYPLLLCLSKKRVYVQEPLYFYRLYREGSLSAIPRRMQEGEIEGISACELLIDEMKKHGFDKEYGSILQQMIIMNLSDLLGAYVTQRQPEEFAELVAQYRGFIRERFPGYQDKTYLMLGGYNLGRILRHMRVLHDPSGRFSFSSLVSLMHPVGEGMTVQAKNKYRQLMVAHEIENQFWIAMKERKPDFIILDLIEERFDLIACEGGYLTKSDALDECEIEWKSRGQTGKVPQMEVVARDSEFCTQLWQDSAAAFLHRMESEFPETKIVLVKNYLAEKVGDIAEQREYAEIDRIRRINHMLEQYYAFIQQTACRILAVEAAECRYYFTDKEYEYGAVPSHLNELVNRDIAKKLEECMGI